MIELVMAAHLLAQDPAPAGCTQALTTLEMNDCHAEDLRLETERMGAYLAASVAQVRLEAEESGEGVDAVEGLVAEIEASQTLWSAYTDQACMAVYTRWQGGTIRVLMALGCKITLTRERTHHLWTEYLSLPDETPALVPEPVKTVAEERSGD